jgi:hypothetical protein
MDINYYKNFNIDLIKFSNNELIKHYNNYGKNENRIYNETVFYEKYSDFDYILYGTINKDIINYSKFELQKHFHLYGCKEQRIFSFNSFYKSYPNYDINNYINKNYDSINKIEYMSFYHNNYNKLNNNNIIIYPHIAYKISDGGINVLYYLAKLLYENGKNVRIDPVYGNIENPHYNNYFNNDFNISESIVIYCEGTVNNPLKTNYCIRWLLSPMGLNVPKNYYINWNYNDLVYYFNYEKRFDNNIELFNRIKLLPLLIIDPIFINYNKIRNNKSCFTFRKSHIHKNIINIHPNNSYEITRNFTHLELTNVFNEYSYFYSYDPLTLLNILAALCGCISVIYPIEGLTKYDWLKTTACFSYIKHNNLDNLYGIAYGIDDIKWAEKTIDFVKEQWDDILEFNKNTYLKSFINDLDNINIYPQKNSINNILQIDIL